MSDSKPHFGQWLTNTVASEDNPQRHGMYVRTIRRTGRTNPGTFYELSDGNGAFWETPIGRLAACATKPCRPSAAHVAEALDFVAHAMASDAKLSATEQQVVLRTLRVACGDVASVGHSGALR